MDIVLGMLIVMYTFRYMDLSHKVIGLDSVESMHDYVYTRTTFM